MTDRRLALGLLWAFLTILSWSGYNVAAVAGIAEGFTPLDLSLLRFGVSGALLLPLGLWLYRHPLRRIGAKKLAVLSIVGGPLFGVVATWGYRYAPLSHGLVFAPAAVLAAGQIWGRLMGKPGFTARQYAGAGLLLVGLVVLSGFDLQQLGPRVLAGDVIFVVAGLMWGSFTFLIGHWRLPPGPVTCGVAGFSLLQVLLACLILRPALPPAPISQIALQAILQGVVGGGLAVLTFALAIRSLGGPRASALPSLTPVMGFVLTYLLFGNAPDAAELAGSLLASTGLLVILTAPTAPRLADA